MPKLLFAGADEFVTGSRHLLEIGNQKLLIDCGLFQGEPEKAEIFNRQFLFKPKEIGAVILTHGHLDHAGGLPLLIERGFAGEIWSTDATRDIAEAILLDAAVVQKENYEHLLKNFPNQKHSPPVFDKSDVPKVMRRFKVVDYRKRFSPVLGVTAELFDAGHIIGSSVARINAGKETLVFSGDLGREHTPTLRDPENVGEAQTLVLEATYGGHLHRGFDFARKRIKQLLHEVVETKGKIIAPSFALGRTQVILAIIAELYDSNQAPKIPIIVDSPLADRMTLIYEKYKKYYDSETKEEMRLSGHSPFAFPELRLVSSREESKALNNLSGPLMIISSSGMAESGRVKHHLARNIHDPSNIVLITGFMARGTLGRYLVEGEPKVRIFGKWFSQNAQVEDLRGLSAHAGQDFLVEYAARISGLRRIFLVHGEEAPLKMLKEGLKKTLPRVKIEIPKLGETASW
ncbi:MAG: MBL fold metallo-hydrolase [bacterium]